MSTQAPSATPGQGPSDAGTQGGQGGQDGAGEVRTEQHLPDPSKVRKGQAALPRKIAPIPDKKAAKSKVALPGVDTGFDAASPFDAKIAKALGRETQQDDGGLDLGSGEAASEFGAEKPEKPAKPAQKQVATPPRGEDGKFLKAAGEQAQEGEPAPPQQEAAPEEGAEEAEETVETPPEPVDEAFEADPRVQQIRGDLDKVSQQYRTLQGMFKPIQLKHQEAVREQHGAAKSAIGWEKVATSLKAENAELRAQLQSVGTTSGAGGQGLSAAAGQSGQGQPNTGDPQFDNIIKAVDWRMYESVKAQGDDVSAVWLLRQALELSRQEREQEISKLREEWRADFRKPEEDRARRNEIAQNAVEVFSRVADIKSADGSLAFPELHDEAKAEAVGKMWVEMGMDPNTLLTPAGVVQAILSYRFYSGDDPRTTAAPPQEAEQQEEGDGEVEEQDQEVQEPATISARALRGMAGSHRSMPVRAGSRPSGGDEAHRIKTAMRESSEIDNIFGFPTQKGRRR